MSTYKVLFVGSHRPPEPEFLLDAVKRPEGFNLFDHTTAMPCWPAKLTMQYQANLKVVCDNDLWKRFREDCQIREKQTETFKIVCYELAKAFAADKRFEVWTANVSWEDFYDRNTVTNYVIKGALDGSKVKKVVFICPGVLNERELPPSQGSDEAIGVFTSAEINKLHNNHQLDLPYSEESSADSPQSTARITIVPQIKLVDAVILIGGGSATEIVGTAADAFGKPIIPVTYFGGAAKRLAENHSIHELQGLLKNQESADLLCLQGKWENRLSPSQPASNSEFVPNSDHANSVVSLTFHSIQARADEEKKVSNRLQWMFVSLICTLVVWVAAYVLASKAPCFSNFGVVNISPWVCQAAPLGVFYLLLFCAAFLGTGLRTLLEYQCSGAGFIALRNLWVEAVMALIVAFGFSLLYLVGSVIYASPVASSTVFENVALTMSLFGLAAGLIMPTETLKARLGEFIKLDAKAASTASSAR